MSHLNTEMQYSTTAQISLNDAPIRGLLGRTGSSTQISLADGYSRTNRVTINVTITSNQIDYVLANNIGSSYLAGKTTINFTINPGVFVYASSTGAWALQISGATTGDVINFYNYGSIRGRGGNGGSSGSGAGSGGGPALYVGCAVNIWNYGDICGGGGGGGGGTTATSVSKAGTTYAGGGSGGGGAFYGLAGATYDSGGAGGGGSQDSGGAGGSPASGGGYGGAGGALGSAGASAGGAGGAGGTAISGNGYISWQATGTRLGGIG